LLEPYSPNLRLGHLSIFGLAALQLEPTSFDLLSQTTHPDL